MKKNRLIAIIISLLTALVLSAVAMSAAADSTQNVVFLSAKGKSTNDGLSADKPVNTMAAAYKKINGNGTIVLCGKYSVSFAADGKFPTSDGAVTITSVYDGVDYREKGAVFCIGANINIGSDMTIENVKIEPSSSPRIFCNGHNVKFGEGIETSANGRAPTVFGGRDLTEEGATIKNSQFFGFTLEVCSGTWQYVTCGNYRSGENCIIGVVGDVNLIINGGTFKATGAGNSDHEVVSGVAGSGLFGDLNMTINDGTFECSVFGMATCSMNGSRRIPGHQGDVRMTINGGNFKGTQIAAVQERTNFLDGDFYLDIKGGSFTSLFSTINADGVDGTAYYTVDPALEQFVSGFGANVYVSPSGKDDADGSASAPVKTLSAAAKLLPKGGRIILLGNINSKNETLDASEGTILITGKTSLEDRSANASLTVSGALTFGSDARFEYLTIKCASNAEICAGGHDLTIGAEVETYNSETETSEGGDVKVEGDLIVSGGDGAEAHKIVLNSGTYLTVRGGMSEAGTAVVINGGTYNGSVYGAGPVKTKGTASVLVNGGVIKANLWGSEKGSSASTGVSITGGHIYTAQIGAARKNSVGGEFSLGMWGGTFYAVPSISTEGAQKASAAADPSLAGAIASIENKVQNVFVADGGTGDGSSPLNPIGSFSEAAKLIGEAGGNIVIMDDVSINNLSTVLAKGPVTITSFGGGCDWSIADDARLVMSDSITISKQTLFDYITIFAAENNTYIAANSNKLEFGEHVTCLVHEGRGVEYPVSVYGGVYISGSSYGGVRATDVTIRSGWYYRVVGGNWRANGKNETARTITGDINLTIYGGLYTNMVAANGNNDLTGNATLNIYGGTFKCPVFGLANNSPDIHAENGTVKGDVTINIWGGTICGNLDASKDYKYNFTGKYTLNVYDGNLTRVTTIRGTEGMAAGACTSTINSDADLKFSEACSGEIEFTNPIAGYADPSVQYDADTGYYYYTYSGLYGGKQAIYLTRAANLCDVGYSDPILIWTAAMQADGRGSEMNSIWAPQINKIDGKWYIYATCADESVDTATRLPYVWVGGEDPTDSYFFHGTIDNYDTKVDTYLAPRFIEYGDQRYIVNGGFYRKEHRSGHQQSLFITKLKSPTAFDGKPVVIATPTTDYEDHKILEGPIGLESPGGTLYLCYAAGHTRGQEYCTGIMKFLGGKNDTLADASLWQKYDDPLHFVDYSTRVYSPGAMMFTHAPDDPTQIWAVYHAKKYTYTAYTMRRLYTQPLTWENDFPVVEDPKPVDTIFTFPLNSRSIESRISGFGSNGALDYTAPDPAPADPEFNDTKPIEDKAVQGTEGISGLTLGLIIGGAVAAVGAACAGVLVVAKKKKKADKAPEAKDSEIKE